MGKKTALPAALKGIEKLLWEAAQHARENAYAPYSSFKVGAALLGADGWIYTGCNVENASYGATLCAERNAVFQAVAAGCRRFRRLLLLTSAQPPAYPCGMCRQVLTEFGYLLPISLVNTRGDVLRTNLKTLLPKSFSKDSL